jgi:hypothetical protein
VKLATDRSRDEAGRHALAARARALGLRDGVEIAVDAILGLLDGK